MKLPQRRYSMELVEKIEDIANLKENRIIGTPVLNNSHIRFEGKGNILYCEGRAVISNSRLVFNANDSLIYFGNSKNEYKMYAALYNDNVFHMGRDNAINDGFKKQLIAILSEQKHIFIGDRCLFSFGVCLRNSDPHLIYDTRTLKRLNPTKSVFIGDHVWFGQDTAVFKGTQIDSGSIIGADSLVSGKRIPFNEIWTGVPCRRLRQYAFWDYDFVHGWREDMTSDGEDFAKYVKKHEPGIAADEWIYRYEPKECVVFDDLDKQISAQKGAEKKLDFLIDFDKKRSKNRFAHSGVTPEKEKGSGFFGHLLGKQEK